jgi:hypothetical protein
MPEQNWVSVITIQGELQAEIMRGLLEAQGVPVQLSGEGVARVYGLTAGPLAEVDILVPEIKLSDAQEVIRAYNAGEFEELGDQFENDGETP